MEDKKLDQILVAIEGIGSKVNGIDVRLGGVESKFNSLDSKVDGNTEAIKNIDSKVSGLESKVDANTNMIERVVLEVVDIKEHIKDKLVTKDEFNNKMDGLYEHVDGLAGKQKVFDSELAAGISRSDRLEKRVEVIENKIAA
mgnify:CR=1 FL=1